LTKSEAVSVIFSGSLPAGAPVDRYAGLIQLAHEFRCRTYLDTSGEPLRRALAARPHFVKPNRDEAAGVLGLPIASLALPQAQSRASSDLVRTARL